MKYQKAIEYNKKLSNITKKHSEHPEKSKMPEELDLHEFETVAVLQEC